MDYSFEAVGKGEWLEYLTLCPSFFWQQKIHVYSLQLHLTPTGLEDLKAATQRPQNEDKTVTLKHLLISRI